MDRRRLLAFVAALPAVSAAPAVACSFSIKTPGFTGSQNQQVQRMFQAWWRRDRDGFRAVFLDRLMNDGSRMEREIADELMKMNPLPFTAFDIFDQYFTEEQKNREISLIINTEAGIIVGCSEADFQQEIRPDCSGTPKLHLFMVAMSGLNVREITHLSTAATPQPSKFDVWSG